MSTQEQEEPFPVFIAWISNEKSVWERMEETKAKSAISNFLEGGVGSGDKKKCFGCNKTGHIRSFCPERKSDSVGGNSNKPRKVLQVKKFWCAYHKDDAKATRCSSIKCSKLREMTDIPKIIQLLKENGDCKFCMGDHLPADCKNQERICGGGKSDRGCTKSHKLHELLCKDAKVFACAVVNVAKLGEAGSEGDEGVLLCIMLVNTLEGYVASVLWDCGATSNFIREEFAKLCQSGKHL